MDLVLHVLFPLWLDADVDTWTRRCLALLSPPGRTMLGVVSSASQNVRVVDTSVVNNVASFLNIPVLSFVDNFFHVVSIAVRNLVTKEDVQSALMSALTNCDAIVEQMSFIRQLLVECVRLSVLDCVADPILVDI